MDTPAIPAVAEPQWANMPQALAQRQQWLLWKYEIRRGQKKPAKVPYYASGGRRTGDQGSDRDRQRLATLDVARRAYANGGWSGVGFAFLPGDGLIGIDIDNAVDLATGQPTERCAAIIAACQSFTERSVSGTGVHIYALGHTHTDKSNDIGLEVFCERQYFIVTGDAWPGTVPDLRPLDDAVLGRLHSTIAQAKQKHRQHASGAPRQPAAGAPVHELRSRVEDALRFVSPDLGYNDWISIGWALKDAFGEFGFGLWDSWSATSAKYQGSNDLMPHWRSFTQDKSADDAVGVVFKRAIEAGWKPPRPQPPAGAVPRPEQRREVPADHAPDNWRDCLLVNGKGAPLSCRENVLYCLRHDPDIAGVVRLNEFTELVERTRGTPWDDTAGEWSEQDDLMLGEYLARAHGIIVKNKSDLRDGVTMAAREIKYNPVVDLINTQAWDGIDRLDHWMVDVLGVDPSPYAALVGRLFIMGMVRRALQPGCKFDYMLVLKGPQGAKKSTVFRELAHPWFTDNAIRMGDKDSLMAMQSVWIAESSELESMTKATREATKQFLSASEDLFRPPYGSRMVKRPRHTVLGGTTNADTFLRDATGDRRFWPVAVLDIDIDALRGMRLQLFAEAKARLQSDDAERRRTWPTVEEEETLIIPAQEPFKQTDVWEDILHGYVNASYTPPGYDPSLPTPDKRDFFSTQELFGTALDIRPDRIDNNKIMQTRVANCMKALGFVPHRETGGRRRRGYLRPKLLPAQAAAPTSHPETENIYDDF